MTSSLSGTTVLVTGAARGIGEHVARGCAARGARVALVGLEPGRLRVLGAELDAPWYEADVTDQAALGAAVAHVTDATGRIDAVVANAGVANLGTVAVSDPDALVRTIEVNLCGAVRTVSATLPLVIGSRGYYLLVSSAAAFVALPGMAAYCASKAGVELFGAALRRETAHLGVRVGVAHPRWVDTDLVRDARSDLAAVRATTGRLPGPFSRAVSVERCADALVRALERRSRTVYVPRSAGLIRASRGLAQSALVDAFTRRRAAAFVPALETVAQGLGRSFGEHSVGEHSVGEHSVGEHSVGEHGVGARPQPGRRAS